MSEPVESVEVVVSMPVELHAEIVAYCDRWWAEPSWAIRRGIRHMLDDEAEQNRRLAALPKRVARGRRAVA